MEYLSILIAVFIIALYFEHKYRLRLYKSLKERIHVTLNIFIFGMLWDYFAVYRHHWMFPGNGLIGIYIYGLPIEEFLFFLIVPYVALVIYKYHEKVDK